MINNSITTIPTAEYRALVERSAYLDIILGSLAEKNVVYTLRELCNAVYQQINGAAAHSDEGEDDAE